MDKMELTKDTKPSRKAFNNFRDIVHHKFETGLRMVELGRLFKENRDQKMWKQFGCKSFSEFLAMPEIGFQRSTVYSFIHIYELYVGKLGIKPMQLCNIGMYKLQQINPVVSDDPEHWLSVAENNSPKDVINLVRERQEKEPMPDVAVEKKYGQYKNYEEFLKEYNCLIHPERESVKAHFPITDKMEGNFVIPLCPECHAELHTIGIDTWFAIHKRKLGQYLEMLVIVAF